MSSNLKVNTILSSTGGTVAVSGILSATSNVSVAGDIDVDGHTNLDNVNIAGVTTHSDHVQIVDGKRLKIGNAENGDLIFIHNGTDSIIDNSTGNLFYRSATHKIQALNASDMIVGNTGGAVELYHNGSKKFETTSTGIDVTGKLRIDIATGGTVGSGVAEGIFLRNTQETDNNAVTIFGGADDYNTAASAINFVNVDHSANYGDISFDTRGSGGYGERLRINSNGHVTKPTNLCLNYTRSASTDYSSGTIVYNTLLFDVNSSGAYNNSTGVFTAPVTGVYHIYHEYYAQTNNIAMTQIEKSTNGGSSYSALYFSPRVSGSVPRSEYMCNGCSFFLQMNANDLMRINVKEGIVHLNNTYTNFMVQLIQ